MIKTETFILPEHWANWLINGDPDGMDEDEFNAMSKWVDRMIEEHGKCWCLGTTDAEPGIMRWHDAAAAFPYAANCLEFVFDVTPEKEPEMFDNSSETSEMDRLRELNWASNNECLNLNTTRDIWDMQDDQ
jgi:hypothetical protein